MSLSSHVCTRDVIISTNSSLLLPAFSISGRMLPATVHVYLPIPQLPKCFLHLPGCGHVALKLIFLSLSYQPQLLFIKWTPDVKNFGEMPPPILMLSAGVSTWVTSSSCMVTDLNGIIPLLLCCMSLMALHTYMYIFFPLNLSLSISSDFSSPLFWQHL